MKKLILIFSFTMCFIPAAKADLFLATHLLLNTVASKYLPEYKSTTFHGPYIGGSYGYRYEVGDAYKSGSDTEGTEKPSHTLSAGYHFLKSDSHKLAITYDRAFTKYQTEEELEGEDTIDSFGFRFNWGLFAFKMGWSNHAFDDESDNKHDGGTFTGIGFDLFFGKFSVFFDLTDHYLEERKKHIAGGDFGLRYSFGGEN
jgi:hypothetical protein